MFGGDAGYRPRVRSAYYERVYVHSPRKDIAYIGGLPVFEKGRVASFCKGLDVVADGVLIFTGAVRAIVQHARFAVLICLPWVVISAAVSFWLYRAEAFGSPLIPLLDIVMVPVIAVLWHRHVLPEMMITPDLRLTFGDLGRYTFKWLLVSFLVGLIAVMGLVVLGLAMSMMPGVDGWFAAFLDGAWLGLSLGALRDGQLAPLLVGALAVLLGFVATYLVHRISYVLPHGALRRETMSLRDGYRRTAPLAGPLAVTSLIVMAGMAAVFGVQVWLGEVLMQAYDSDKISVARFDLWTALIEAVSVVLQTLIGAALLTEIYRRIGGAPRPDR